MSGHTPGPWTVDHDVRGLGRVVASLGTNVEGVPWFVHGPDAVPDEALPANARLIAAAPDLLEALEYAVVSVCYSDGTPIQDGDRTWVAAARDAIALATLARTGAPDHA